jgi:hypothetical protein
MGTGISIAYFQLEMSNKFLLVGTCMFINYKKVDSDPLPTVCI